MLRQTVDEVKEQRSIPSDWGPVRWHIPIQDVRLKRELAHRRHVVLTIRRMTRVLSLHVLDGLLLTGSLFATSRLWTAPEMVELLPAFVIVLLLSLNAAGAYRPGEGRRDAGRLLSGVALGTLILFAVTFFPPHANASPTVLLFLSFAGFVSLALGRKLADMVVRQAYVHGIGLRRAVVIGNLEEVGQAIQQLRDERNIDQYIVGHLAPDHEPDPAALGILSEISSVLDKYDVQEVVLAASLPQPAVRSLAEACFERGTLLYVFPAVLGSVECRVEPLYVGACPLMHLTPARLEVPGLFVKRIFDLLVSLAVLLVMAPVMAAIAIAIRLDSPGPVFFRQQRVGLGGRIFTIWKFRSMYTDAESKQKDLVGLNAYGHARLFKVQKDPRVTPIGRFLRRSSLDELPQLFNVLIGDMSLVGPRPPLPSEVEEYEPHHFERLTVVPGITGPWQVGGRNLITDFEKVVRMERSYIQSWSLLEDAKILLRTVKVVITGEGAF